MCCVRQYERHLSQTALLQRWAQKPQAEVPAKQVLSYRERSRATKKCWAWEVLEYLTLTSLTSTLSQKGGKLRASFGAHRKARDSIQHSCTVSDRRKCPLFDKGHQKPHRDAVSLLLSY